MSWAAIDLESSNDHYMTITDNIFETCNRGIRMRNVLTTLPVGSFTPTHLISGNSYAFNGILVLGGTGSTLARHFITISNAFRNITPLTIQNNTNVNQFYQGIRLENVTGNRDYGVNVSSNTLTFAQFNSTNFLYGLRTLACGPITFSQNLVTRANVTAAPVYTNNMGFRFHAPAGLSVESSDEISADNNSFYFCAAGMRFFNSNAPQYLMCNLMDNNRRGVVLQSSFIGDQGNDVQPQDNQWVGSTLGLEAAEGVGSFLSSIWHTRSNTAYPLAALNQIPLVGSGNPVDMPPPTTGGTPNCTYPCIGPGCRIAHIVKIAKEEDFYISLSDESKWSAKVKAYAMLKEDSTLMYQNTNDDSVLQVFYNFESGTDIGKLYNVKEYINANDPANAEIENNAVMGNLQAELNCKIVNEIYLQTWAIDTFDLDIVQVAALESIAYSSPIEGGPCVYSARVMLDLDLNDGVEEGERMMNLNGFINKAASQFVIYPNPATSLIKIVSSEAGIFLIKAISGRQAINIACAGGIKEIDVNSLSAGIYLYNFQNSDGYITTGKLSIVK